MHRKGKRDSCKWTRLCKSRTSQYHPDVLIRNSLPCGSRGMCHLTLRRRTVHFVNFCCFPPYSKRVECYHCRASRGLQIPWSHYTSSFFMSFVFDSCCIIQGRIQEIHLTKFLFPFSRLLTVRERRRSETLAILNCGWQQELYWGYLLPLIVGLISFKTCPAVLYKG